MPRIIKTIRRGRRGPSLETLVFRMGGVAGAVRRILRSRDRVTVNQVYAALEDKHPQLKPASNQVEDVLQRMVQRRQLEVKANTRRIRTYKWTPRRSAPKATEDPKQMELL